MLAAMKALVLLLALLPAVLSAADEDDVAEVLDLRRPAEGADNVHDGLAGLEGAESFGGRPDDLDDEGDGAGRGVGIGDGQGNAFTAVPDADDYEMAGAVAGGHPGRFHDDPPYRGGQPLGFAN